MKCKILSLQTPRKQTHTEVLEKSETIAFAAKWILWVRQVCLLHFAGRKSQFREARCPCWGHTALLVVVVLVHHFGEDTMLCTSSFSYSGSKILSPASENNYGKVSTTVPHPTLSHHLESTSFCQITEGWLSPLTTLPTKLDGKNTQWRRK